MFLGQRHYNQLKFIVMKRLLFILPLVLCIVISCQDKAAKAELENLKSQKELEEQNKELARKMMDAWTRNDIEALKEIFAPNYVFYYPSGNTNTISRSDVFKMRGMLQSGFPDLDFNMEDLYAEDDIVIFRFIQTGTHQGEYMGIPATGKKINGSGILISRVKKGKIIEQWEEFNSLGVMQQLGMELKMEEENL